METGKKLDFGNGTIEALKWLAVILMTVDHINTFLFDRRYEWMFDIGRVAFPLFGFVFAYNMARPQFFDSFGRRFAKLIAIGVVAQVPMVLMGMPLFHLNIMFTLAFAALTAYMALGMTRVVGFAVIGCSLVLVGMVVDYGAVGMLYILTVYNLARRPGIGQWVIVGTAMALLFAINGNLFALLALPLLWGAQHVRLACPRARWAFYAYYPAHLSVLAALSLTAFKSG